MMLNHSTHTAEGGQNPRIVLNSGVFAVNEASVQSKHCIFSHLFGLVVNLLHFGDTSSLVRSEICSSWQRM